MHKSCEAGYVRSTRDYNQPYEARKTPFGIVHIPSQARERSYPMETHQFATQPINFRVLSNLQWGGGFGTRGMEGSTYYLRSGESVRIDRSGRIFVQTSHSYMEISKDGKNIHVIPLKNHLSSHGKDIKGMYRKIIEWLNEQRRKQVACSFGLDLRELQGIGINCEGLRGSCCIFSNGPTPDYRTSFQCKKVEVKQAVLSLEIVLQVQWRLSRVKCFSQVSKGLKKQQEILCKKEVIVPIHTKEFGPHFQFDSLDLPGQYPHDWICLSSLEQSMLNKTLSLFPRVKEMFRLLFLDN